jgi:hypothetical protein
MNLLVAVFKNLEEENQIDFETIEHVPSPTQFYNNTMNLFEN